MRAEHVEALGQTAQLEAASRGSVARSLEAAGLEESLWLCPIEDRRRLDSTLVELNASGLFLLGQAIETACIRAGGDEPEIPSRSVPLLRSVAVASARSSGRRGPRRRFLASDNGPLTNLD